ncbi:hypothetical protein DNTS_028786 [Danionella cerebrum]|uniref:Rho-GAP domain-containing protein n=1 Tax=Danionella cerebrum TaxID=2873325 RepID=A0A553Q9U6_9TELE|nr:hypothetical protein DNTS_028786 [Danionella translucida]
MTTVSFTGNCVLGKPSGSQRAGFLSERGEEEPEPGWLLGSCEKKQAFSGQKKRDVPGSREADGNGEKESRSVTNRLSLEETEEFSSALGVQCHEGVGVFQVPGGAAVLCLLESSSLMKNKAAKLKSKRKGSENAFGCDLTEHLQSSGQDVPHVLKTCAEFIEKHGIVDGIYRLSGITSNIQKLRQEFISELCPDLTKEVYLQDIHCVGSLCKLYFRELPNPLLTYQLYKKFTDAVSRKEEQEQLLNMRSVIKELPVSHLRTLEYLTRHLAYLATLSHQTNMHTRNLALVWAPNLLRSKEVEEPSCNGDIAFQEVRVQQSVVEFILSHTEQIFSQDAQPLKPREGPSVACVEKYATLPASSQCGMKLMSLEEAQARSLSPNHPVMRERQRENSLPDSSGAAMYHTVIDPSDSSLGRSVIDSRAKLSRNGSVFMRAANPSEKPAIRPSKSMDSLCSFQAPDEERAPVERNNGVFVPVFKSRTLGSDIDYSLNPRDPPSASGGFLNDKQEGAPPSHVPKSFPEQLKVFKGDDRYSCQPTSPKNRRMLYSGPSNNGSSRPSFPGSLFPTESSPRHQRKALNISEPFAVSVPLRVSAVINSNSTPCRAPGKERERSLGAVLKPSEEAGALEGHWGEAAGTTGLQMSSSGSFSFADWENQLAGQSGGTEELPGNSSGGSGCSIYSNSSSIPVEVEGPMRGRDACPLDKDAKVRELKPSDERSEPQASPEAKAKEELDTTGSVLGIPKLDKLEVTDKKPSLKLPQKCLATEAKSTILEEFVKPKKTGNQSDLKLSTQARRSSLPPSNASLKGLYIDLTKNVTFDHSGATSFNTVVKHTPERLFSCDGGWNYLDNGVEHKTQKIVTTNLQLSPFLHLKETDILQDLEPCKEEDIQADPAETGQIYTTDSKDNSSSCVKLPVHTNLPIATTEVLGTKDFFDEEKKVRGEPGKAQTQGKIKERQPPCLSVKHVPLGIQDDVDTAGNLLVGLDQVEPWEDLCSAKEWVTSPLHSPKLEYLLLTPKEAVQDQASLRQVLDKPKVEQVPDGRNSDTRGSVVIRDITSSQTLSAVKATCELENSDFQTGNKTADTDLSSLPTTAPHFENTNLEVPKFRESLSLTIPDEAPQKVRKATQQRSFSSQRFQRQISHETCITEKPCEKSKPKLRPCSLNLDLVHHRVRDISGINSVNGGKQAWEWAATEAKLGSSSPELEFFLSSPRAPLRRNSAPVSVSSVRAPFMIKTCQAKAVPVIPPKIQYSHVPQTQTEIMTCEKSTDQIKSKPGKKPTKGTTGTPGSLFPLQKVREQREDHRRGEPLSRVQRHKSMNSATHNENYKPDSIPDLPVLRRKRSANGDTFMDRPRPERSALLQRSSFRNRPRPQSLILFSPPFPIIDYHAAGDDAKQPLSPIAAETSQFDAYANELVQNLKSTEEVTLRNKMTMPKSGQRLETSTSCFYQPQRRSMIFDNRSNRQNE